MAALGPCTTPTAPTAPTLLKKADVAPAMESHPTVVVIKKVNAIPPRPIDRPVRTLPPREVVVDEPPMRGPPMYRPLRFEFGYGGGGMMGRPMGFPGRRF